MRQSVVRLILAILLLALADLHASLLLPTTFDENFQNAAAVFRGTVLETTAYKNPADGLIYTRTLFRVDEAFKGKYPAVIKLVHRGGEVDGVGMTDDLSPKFVAGEECVLFVSRRGDGTLFASQGEASVVKLPKNQPLLAGSANILNRLRAQTVPAKASGADVTDQAVNVLPDGFRIAPSGDNSGASTNGLLADSSGIPIRFPAPDRGEPIPYIVDATFLPAGMTLPQALTAVSNALTAWSSASSFKFIFAGTNNFGQASPTINATDGIFRIQLHDAYNYITQANVLGEGGSYYTVGLLANAGWGTGGRVINMEFNKGLCGYVVLKHTNPFMENLASFTEVLTHEIGHVLGLAHSSEVQTNDTTLANSIMYFQAHGDGRGASLNSYDTNVIRTVHPFNTPPYAYNRYMDITTSPFGAPNVTGINSVELRGYDLQSTNLTLATNNASANPAIGSFSLTGNILKFTAVGYYSDARVDPAANAFYEIIYARFSDGTNASPYISISTLSHNPDTTNPSDGIPDAWMTANFGHSAPGAGDKSRASDDADGDKLTNLQEYIAGMNPTNSTSAQRITLISTNVLQWQAKAYELYEIQSSTNLASTNWTRFGNPVMPTTATGSFTNPYNPAAPRLFFRVQKVP
jgi:hypothetical protein